MGPIAKRWRIKKKKKKEREEKSQVTGKMEYVDYFSPAPVWAVYLYRAEYCVKSHRNEVDE